MSRHEMSVEIADSGAWEEFHQKRGEWVMYDYHKSRRLRLMAEYRRLFR